MKPVYIHISAPNHSPSTLWVGKSGRYYRNIVHSKTDKAKNQYILNQNDMPQAPITKELIESELPYIAKPYVDGPIILPKPKPKPQPEPYDPWAPDIPVISDEIEDYVNQLNGIDKDVPATGWPPVSRPDKDVIETPYIPEVNVPYVDKGGTTVTGAETVTPAEKTVEKVVAAPKSNIKWLFIAVGALVLIYILKK